MPNYKNGDRPTIGVLVGWQVYEGGPHTFLEPLFHGINAAARDRDCNVLLACGVAHTGGGIHPAWPVLAPDTNFVPVGPWNTDGLIAVTPLLSDARSRYVRQLMLDGFPVVFVGTGESGPAIVIDNEGGIRQALAHLVEHGHRRIAFIAGHGAGQPGDSEYRLRSYQTGLHDYGLEADRRLLAYGLHTRPDGRKAMHQILNSGAQFTAVLASNDESASGAIEVLKEAGLRVPQDVAVIGFDDRLDAIAQAPSLTSLHYPIFDIGRQAFSLLLKYIDGQKKGPEIVRVPTRLVIRQSCGCRPGVVVSTLENEARVAADSLKLKLIQMMAEAVLAEARQLNMDEATALCQRVVEAFIRSLEEDNTEVFYTTFNEILRGVEAVDDDTHAWQAPISVLRSGLPTLLKELHLPATRKVSEDDMLHQARVAISESARRRYGKYLMQNDTVSNDVGWMTARLLAAMDEGQILWTLSEYLPGLSIRHAHVIFYEPEKDDQVAWSVLRANPGAEGIPIQRFPSRQFPPPGLYPANEPYFLALLPLIFQEEVAGFVAFDAGNLGVVCVTIVRQLAVALKSARLHSQVLELSLR